MKLKKFNDWKMLTKIFGLVSISVVPLILIILFYLIPIIRKTHYDEKAMATKKTVDVAVSILDEYKVKVSNNTLPIAEAQKEALQAIRSLRYSGNEYFWINDLNSQMIMHPIKPAMENTNVAGMKDSNGKFFFRDMVNVCNEKGEGIVEYMWPKPGSDKPQPKISYVKLFKDWGWIVGSGIYVDEIESEITAITNKILLLLFVVILAILVFAYSFSKKLIKPLDSLREIANKIALGDVNVKIEAKSKDEIGYLEQSFAEMIDNIKLQAIAAEKIAMGDMDVKVNVRSEHDVLSLSMQKVVQTLKELINETLTISMAAIDGELSVRGNGDKFKGGYNEVITGINNTLDALVNPVKEGVEALQILASGDLTVKIKSDYKGEHQLIKNNINVVAETLNDAIMEVGNAVQATASAANQISSSSEEMAAGASEQNTQTAEVAGAIEQMTKTILETSKYSSMAAEAAKNAGDIAKEGGKVVAETIEGMNRIAAVVSESAATVQALGKNSDQIGEIIQVIDDIADQTNLLALNAAIEAARAGEQGRGFAVVADEVRKLAERTTKATKEIASMIKQIQADTSGAVKSMEQGTKEVENGKLLTDKAGKSLKEIIKSAGQVVDIISQVATSGDEQSKTSEQISKSIDAISNVTQESTAGIQETARASEDLSRLTVNLQELISKFKIDVNINSKSNDSFTRSKINLETA
ncbi:MAG: methyl-accepting chemotaxis protein [Ignavibacteriaceae bacterium]|nr:methyl-accepting chemotaxis protein [Ignavibacteriaceae bacterium]